MRRLLFLTGIIVLTFAISACNIDQNRHHRDMMNDGHMGDGMMGGSQQSGQQFSQDPKSGNEQVTYDRARTLAQLYLESTGNTNFILGEGQEGNSGYEFPLLVHADSSRVASLLVDKQTGEVSSQK